MSQLVSLNAPVSRFTSLGQQLNVSLPSFFQSIIDMLFEAPLFQLYIHGPAFHNFGFWEGRPKEEICSSMTGVPTSHWSINQMLCEELILNRFESWIVLVYVGIYLWILFKIALQTFKLCRYSKRFKKTKPALLTM